MGARGLLFSLIALLLCPFAYGQSGIEVSWRASDKAHAQTQFVASDDDGFVYAVEGDGTSNSVIEIYDLFGNFVKQIPLNGVATGFALDRFAGVPAVLVGSTVIAYYWNGEIDALYGNLGFGFDQYGRLIGASINLVGQTLVDYHSDGAEVGQWTAPACSSAVIDSNGNALLVGSTGSAQSGTNYATFYSSAGKALWTRSYTFSLGAVTFIEGFIEDFFGNGYLFVNLSDRLQSSGNETWVECIDPQNGASDKWQSPRFPGNTSLFADSFSHLYLAGFSSSSSFVTAIDISNKPGSVLWDQPAAADRLAAAEFGALLESYDGTHGLARYTVLDPSSGLAVSSMSVPFASASDVGPLIIDDRFQKAPLQGGGGSSGALTMKLALGPSLASLSAPAAVIGGLELPAIIKWNQTPQPGAYVNLTSSNSKVIDPPFLLDITSEAVIDPIPTQPVDSDTAVSLSASDGYVNRSASLTVQTAVLSSLKIATASLTPDETTVATVSLTGAAGPSGKLVSLSSNNAAVTLPGTVKILPSKQSAAFSLNTHPVQSSTLVQLQATCEGASVSAELSVLRPIMKAFSLSKGIVVGGSQVTGTVNLTGIPAANLAIALGSSNPSAAIVPPSVVAAGPTETFAVSTQGVSTSALVTVKASFGGATLSRTLTVEPALLATVVASPAVVVGGKSASLTLTLTGDAPPAGAAAMLVSSDPVHVRVPASARFLPNGTTSSVSIATSSVSTQQTVTITATYLGRKVSGSITLTP